LTSYMRSIAKDPSLWYKHAMAWRHLKSADLSDSFLSAIQDSYVTLPCRLCEWWLNNTNVSMTQTQIMSDVVDVASNNSEELLSSRKCVLEEFGRLWDVRFSKFPDRSRPGNLGFDAIFVVHYSKLLHRKPEMEKRIAKSFFRDGQWVPILWIDVLDREALDDSFVKMCIGTATVRRLQRILNDPHRENYLGEDSATLKHLFSAYALLRSSSWVNALILEDDATFVDEGMGPSGTWHGEKGIFQTILRDLPVDYDIVMLSRYDYTDSQTVHLPRVGNHLILAQSSRVASAYLISRKGARNMLLSLPVIGPPDFQINYAAMDPALARTRGVPEPLSSSHGMKVFHSVPWISDQMDMTGTARSLIK